MCCGPLASPDGLWLFIDIMIVIIIIIVVVIEMIVPEIHQHAA